MEVTNWFGGGEGAGLHAERTGMWGGVEDIDGIRGVSQEGHLCVQLGSLNFIPGTKKDH